MALPLWIMVAGPYRSGSSDATQWRSNLRLLNKYAYHVYLKGHVPIIGVNVVLPVIEAAGEDKYDEMMMPLCLSLAEKCDAVLRIGGPSKGADQEVEYFRDKGLPVYYSLEEIP